MNLAFLLQSFGIKLGEKEIEAATATVKAIPEIVPALVARIENMERLTIETHAMAAAIQRALPSLPATDLEHARQVALFPPDLSALESAQHIVERSQYDGKTNGHG